MVGIELTGNLLTDLIEYSAFFCQSLLTFIGLAILDCQHSLPGQSEKKILILLLKSPFFNTFEIQDTYNLVTIEQRYIQFRDNVSGHREVDISPWEIFMYIIHAHWFFLLYYPP